MTHHDPPRLRELDRLDSRLSELLDAATDDVAPADVLARTAQRLGAATGLPLASSAMGSGAAG